MDFSGIEATDLADVQVLNKTFLEYLAGPDGALLRQPLPASLREVVRDMTQRHVRRLATVPFLLMSCREQDDAYWRHRTTEQTVRDLFAPAGAADPVAQIAAATLGFLWQLSRKNPYAARMLSGASVTWCEQLATASLFDVLQSAAVDPQLLTLRCGTDAVFWRRLVGAGLSSNVEIRRAAHLNAMQTVLSQVESQSNAQFRSAACRTRTPALQLREVKDR